MATTAPTTSTAVVVEEEGPLLPVIIVGAGPCGLVAALTLQQQGIPFVVLEQATREKLCSNAGSGIDMAPTAIRILEDELDVSLLAGGEEAAMRAYDYLYVADMNETPVQAIRFQDVTFADDRAFGFANRAGLQRVLLAKIEPEHVQCGVSVQRFTQSSSSVEVHLSDGTTRKGSVLLACDGIHSAIRAHMHKDTTDELHYCGQECWWGKATVVPGSELDKALRDIETEQDMQVQPGSGAVGIGYIPTAKRPGCFFSCPVSEGTHAWAYILENKTSPLAKQSDDLTRRGGTVLTPEQKRQELLDQHDDMAKLMRLIVEATPDVTRAAFFDRKNLNLPYTQGRVALLGDAAHPQSPAMGQGAVRAELLLWCSIAMGSSSL